MLKVLIVDDERIERNGLAMLVKRLSLPFETFDAPNGADALNMMREQSYDVLLTDIRMPFMDGIQLAHEVRKLHPETCIIIFSAYADFQNAQKAMREDVFRYLLKPVDVMEFKQVMLDAANRIEQGRAATDRMTMLEKEILAYRTKERRPGSRRENPSAESTGSRAVSPAVAEALAVIREEYGSPLGLNEVAERVYLNPSYFSTVFRREVGESYVRYLNNYRLEKAAEALKSGNQPVGEIRRAVGFSGDSYFIALFRERYGCTPQQFRLAAAEGEDTNQ